MDKVLDELERNIAELRHQMRTAATKRDDEEVGRLHEQLRRSETAWESLLGVADTPPRVSDAPGLPTRTTREGVLDALTLIGAPAPQRTIRAVHQAFFGAELPTATLATLRRDEERSFLSGASPRTYICPALVAGQLTPVRSILAISDWPLVKRIRVSSSERVDFLTMLLRLAETAKARAEGDAPVDPAVDKLLRRLARGLTGPLPDGGLAPLADVIARRAPVELKALEPDDTAARTQAAQTASLLPAAQQLFGAPSGQSDR
ncbi:hypothetical protein PV726_31340 [Streptomyces europaeiscabiei]|uniref:hypothetical protein n=1 Tax=Streptomyces europaeiscabiei TaxID=146819 RepID=UPI0029AC3934|nr:hypothetical protein [Streptomyces europaeiscabiei]MDX3694749.1 hypothetical protein [Streptomyces europaeiscabiei]